MADWFDSQNTGVTGGQLGGATYAPNGSITAPGFYAPPAITSGGGYNPDARLDPNLPQNGGGFAGPSDPRLLPQRPGSDFGMAGGYNPNARLDPNLPQNGGGFALPQGPYGSPMSTFGDFLKDPSKMQAVGQGLQHITGMIGGGQNTAFPNASPVARGSNPTTMGSLFGSAFGAAGGAGGQMARVMMKAPDGSTQSVDPAHVPHYTGLGAQVINGSSYGGNGGY